MNMFDIGSRIKLRREQIGLSQEELGDVLKLSKSTISRYEAGEIRSLDVDTAARFAHALKCDPVWLSGWKDGEMYVPNDIIDDIIKALHKQPMLMELINKARKMRHKDMERLLKIAEVMNGSDEGERV